MPAIPVTIQNKCKWLFRRKRKMLLEVPQSGLFLSVDEVRLSLLIDNISGHDLDMLLHYIEIARKRGCRMQVKLKPIPGTGEYEAVHDFVYEGQQR